eukprot:Opistho-2@21675
MERRRASGSAQAAPPPAADGVPFYRPPRRQMSSEIVAEARASLKRPSRPFTPLDTTRSLFGTSPGVNSPIANRPPSVYSIGSRQFEMGSSPDLTKPFRLDPLNYEQSREAADSVSPRPPSTEPPSRFKRRSRSASSLSREQSVDMAADDDDDWNPPVSRTQQAAPTPDERPPRSAPRSANAVVSAAATGALPPQQSTPRRKTSEPSVKTTTFADEQGGALEARSSGRSDAQPQSQSHRDAREPSAGIGAGTGVGAGAGAGAGGQEASQRPTSGSSARAVRPDSAVDGDEICPEWQEAESLLAVLDPDEPNLDAMCEACDGLWAVVQRKRFAGRQRNAILRSMYRLMDSPDARLLIKLCRVVLRVTKGGTTLFNACKMLFKLSRVESNDSHFQDCGMIELLVSILGNADKRATADALVFCAGILKNLSNDDTAQRLLAKAGCIDIVARLLAMVNSKDPEIMAGGDSVGHLLFQVRRVTEL